jgi:hypothetical protein
MQKQLSHPLDHPVVYALIVGTIIFVVGVCVEFLLHTRKTGGGWELIDNLITACLIGLIVFAYERRRSRDIRQRLRVIAAMNHHIRNALQSILWAPYYESQPKQIKSIRDSVERIEWALREILPGESGDSDPLPPTPRERLSQQ